MPFGKRLFDLSASILLLLVLSPLMLVLFLLTWIALGTPVIFLQERPGWKGKPFSIMKFRTMADRKAPDGSLLPDEIRLTRWGRFLRSTSLDELPELFNVLRGEMSLVGPRPLLMKYLPRYSAEQMRRHAVVPGVTGWAQVNGRNALTWDEKFRLDIWYVDNWSFWLDVKILLQTIWITISRQGISQPGHATMEEFQGDSGLHKDQTS
jgi:sugar transferase EpsL